MVSRADSRMMVQRERSNLKAEQTRSKTEDHAVRDRLGSRKANRGTNNLGFTPEL